MTPPSIADAVETLLARVEGPIVCATPLGLGKPVPLVNALYARAKGGGRALEIVTALSLEVPRASGDLERRFLAPFAERVFEGVPELDYLADLRKGTIPPHIRISEFYFRPGSMLANATSQQNYISSNYTHVARDMRDRGVNAVLVMVAERGGRYSLSCNPDLTLDIVEGMRAGERRGMLIAMVNRNLPFMTGDAEVGADWFDLVVDVPEGTHRLFGVPNPAADLCDHAVGIRVAALVKDGGTLQVGIGSLGDAITYWIGRRHGQNADFRSALAALGAEENPLVARLGGTEPFEQGLFASSEMFTWGLMTLIRDGVVRRRAEGDSGPILEAAFFLGPEAFYQVLRDLPEERRALIRMTAVSRINDIYGDEAAVRRQRRDARFVNACMMTMLSGASVSDGLDDGRVVSGVGGQYNFVAMAHELAGARSILVQRAVREAGAGVQSNIVFNYGHTTIPRHLRDIVVTEYGVADLRGKTDAEVAAALIAIADSRFQEDLAARAKAAGKLARDWAVPEAARGNTPEGLGQRLTFLAQQGALPRFPLGTDFDATEERLVAALQWLKDHTQTNGQRLRLALSLLSATPRDEDALALARMGLGRPSGLRERILRRALSVALRRAG